MAEGVADPSTAHIVSLVNRQKQAKTSGRSVRKPYLMRSSGFSVRYSSKTSRGSSYSTTSVYSTAKTKSPTVSHSKMPSAVPKATSSQPAPSSLPKVPTPSPVPKVPTPSSVPKVPVPSSVPKAPVPSRKYEIAPRFLRLQERKLEAANQRAASPPVRTSPTRRSPVHMTSKVFLDRILPTVSTLRMDDDYDDYSAANQYIQSPRPLLPSRTLGRVDRLKQLDAAETAKEYIEIYSRMNGVSVKYTTKKIGQKKRSQGYISNLYLGPKKFISYPNLASSEEEAEEFAAKAAMEAIQ